MKGRERRDGETVRVDEWEKGGRDREKEGRDSERGEKRGRAETRERVGGEETVRREGESRMR